MTTITFKNIKGASSDSYPHATSYARKIVDAWHQWQAARAIESMPLDVRKDIGWPSATAANERKVM